MGSGGILPRLLLVPDLPQQQLTGRGRPLGRPESPTRLHFPCVVHKGGDLWSSTTHVY